MVPQRTTIPKSIGNCIFIIQTCTTIPLGTGNAGRFDTELTDVGKNTLGVISPGLIRPGLHFPRLTGPALRTIIIGKHKRVSSSTYFRCCKGSSRGAKPRPFAELPLSHEASLREFRQIQQIAEVFRLATIPFNIGNKWMTINIYVTYGKCC